MPLVTLSARRLPAALHEHVPQPEVVERQVRLALQPQLLIDGRNRILDAALADLPVVSDLLWRAPVCQQAERELLRRREARARRRLS